MIVCQGDAVTPGFAARADGFRLKQEDVEMPPIPSQPIGYDDAKAILQWVHFNANWFEDMREKEDCNRCQLVTGQTCPTFECSIQSIYGPRQKLTRYSWTIKHSWVCQWQRKMRATRSIHQMDNIAPQSIHWESESIRIRLGSKHKEEQDGPPHEVTCYREREREREQQCWPLYCPLWTTRVGHCLYVPDWSTHSHARHTQLVGAN